MNDITTALLEKYSSGDANPEERRQVETWLQDNNISPGQLRQFLHLPEGVKMMLRNDPEKAWEKIKPSLGTARKRVVPLTRTWLQAAAAVTLLIGVTAVFYLLNFNQENIHVIANSTGASKTVALPDSSIVYLHAGAEIAYNDSYRDNRSVTMKGQVFFDVKRDTKHPFQVAVGESVVQVLGTSFNIHDDVRRLEVTVATGKVSVETPTHEKVYLVKGEKASYAKREHQISKLLNDDINYDSWKTKVLQFRDTPLPQVLSTLEEYFDIVITFDQNKARTITYTSDFNDPTLQEVLTEMKDVLSIEYKESGKQVTIILP